MTEMTEVQRIYPEAKSGLIHWIEENFADIDSFVCTFKLADNSTMTAYYSDFAFEAMGLTAIQQAAMQDLYSTGQFKNKRGEQND